jgi:heptaprenyl diphosphate synthase
MSPLDALGFAPMAPDMERVEAALRGSVRAEDPFLSDVAGHLIAAGGKRLRPALAVCAAYAAKGLGPVSDDAITGGVSVELVHLGSLYHDDVIDEAETRRGVPSVNARWSNIVAILAGDYLLARASALAASLGADVAALLASTIGELCRGQVLELQHLFDVDRSVETYTDAISGKTAALFATACRVGGLVSAVDDPTLESLTTFGFHLGMCFQVVDDVLDVTGTDESLGKPAGNDILEGVYTLPVIHTLESSAELRDLLGRKIDRTSLPRARELVTTGDAVARAIDTAREHAANASTVLRASSALDADVVAGLTRLVDTLVTREF